MAPSGAAMILLAPQMPDRSIEVPNTSPVPTRTTYHAGDTIRSAPAGIRTTETFLPCAHAMTSTDTWARLWIGPFTLDDVLDATAAVGLLRDNDEQNRE